MQTIIDPAIEATPQLAAHVTQAKKILDSVLTASEASTRSEWRIDHDERNRAIVELRFSNDGVSVTGQFTPRELKQPAQMKGRLIRLWGDLLQKLSHQDLARLRRSVQALEEAEDSQNQHGEHP